MATTEETTGHPVAAYVFMASLCVPLFFNIGPLRLAPFLLVLLVLFPPMFFKWVSGKQTTVQLPDLLLLFYCAWCAIALAMVHGVSFITEPATIVLLQTFGSYLVGRIYVRNEDQLRKVVRFHFALVLALLPFALFETVKGYPLLNRIFGALGPVFHDHHMPTRMGLRRVQSVFEHPILYGIFVSSTVGMLFSMDRFSSVKVVAFAAIAVATFVSLSTGALLCLMIQIILLTWGMVMGKNEKKWKMIIIIFISCYITIDLLSNRSPFEVFVSYMTFNTGSAYNRVFIWKYGTAEVYRHPLFGIGYNDWIRPWFIHSSSMDNFWLLQAVRYGLPAWASMTVAFVILLIRLSAVKFRKKTSGDLRTGFVISIVGVFFAICSVHLWNSAYCWLLFLMGSATWMLEKGPHLADAIEGNDPEEDKHQRAGARRLQAGPAIDEAPAAAKPALPVKPRTRPGYTRPR